MPPFPIFIHSLFRSGSTYFFHVFRRSPANYYCFQEALHPVVYFNREYPQELLKFSETIYKLLRHPNLEKPYFYELVPLADAWKDKISFSALFDGYFGHEAADNGIEFFRAILNQVKDKKPVFEECRTSNRIGLFKKAFGGFHIYLWRNPWDQWWSYKTTNGFDYQNRLIISAPNSFKAIAKLRTELGYPQAFSEAPAPRQDGVFTAEESYLVYYMIWCLGLYEGLKHADLLISIDTLTESQEYREKIVSDLARNGIEQIDFSDCYIPRGNYYKEDADFFTPLEEKVHAWLLEDISADELSHIQEMRRNYAPFVQKVRQEAESKQEKNIKRQITQLREISRRFESAKTFYLREYLLLRDSLENEMQKSRMLEIMLAEIQNSHSWRLTQPFRWFTHQWRQLHLLGWVNRLKKLLLKSRKQG